MNIENEGWIKLHRQLIKWEWYKKSEMVHLFLHFLFLANHKEKKWQGQVILKGQFVSGRKKLAAETGISEQTLRTCINRLKSTNELTSKATSKFTIFTVVNYEKYQQSNQQSNQQLTNNQPTTNQQLTTTKNVKNIRIKELKNNIYSPTSNEVRLASLLGNLILKRKADHKDVLSAKKNKWQKWGKHINSMIRLDKRTPENIEKVIIWSQNDIVPSKNGFCWANNVLSTNTLRKQFDQLELKLKQEKQEIKKSVLGSINYEKGD